MQPLQRIHVGIRMQTRIFPSLILSLIRFHQSVSIFGMRMLTLMPAWAGHPAWNVTTNGWLVSAAVSGHWSVP
jgi:hypothetical protein